MNFLAQHISASDTITSVANDTVRFLVKLREDAGFRKERQKVLVTRSKIVAEISPIFLPSKIYVVEGQEKYLPTNTPLEIVTKISRQVLQRITGFTSVNDNLVAVYDEPKPKSLDANHKRILVMDYIKDPGNVGTMLRSALGLGFDCAWVSPRSADPFSEKSTRSSRGANLILPGLHRDDSSLSTEQFLNRLLEKNFLVLIAHQNGKPINDVLRSDQISQGNQRRSFALVLGNEARGMDTQTRVSLAAKGGIGKVVEVSVPIRSTSGLPESYNVSAAAAILMYEITKT